MLIPDFFFPQKISKMETKYKNASKSLVRTFIYTVEKKKKLGMDTVEHTASTILVVQMTMKKKGLFLFHTGALVVYKPHGYLWVQFFFPFFVPTWDGWGLQVRFCHIWTLSGVFFSFSSFFSFPEEEWQVSQEHGQDPPTGPLCVVVDPETWWSTTEQRREKKNQGWALFRGERSAGPYNPRGNWEGDMSTPGPCTCLHLNPHEHSYPALTNSPMHFCSFKLWGTILGMGAQLQQEDCYDFDKVTEKIFPNWNKRLEKHVFSHLLYIIIFLYYLSK